MADHLAVHAAAVGQPHLQPLGAFDDMGIGHDEPAGIDYEAGPAGASGLAGRVLPLAVLVRTTNTDVNEAGAELVGEIGEQAR